MTHTMTNQWMKPIGTKQNRTYLVDQLRKRFNNAKKDKTIKSPDISNLTELNHMKKDKLIEKMQQCIDDNKPK